MHEVTLNGRSLDPAEVFDGVRLQLPTWPRTTCSRSSADAVYMNTGEGLHRFVDPVDGEVYLYSQFEVADSRRVFAVFEQPDLKATFTLHRHRPGRTGRSCRSTRRPSPEPAGDGKARLAVRADAGAVVVRHRGHRRAVPRASSAS